MGHEGVDDGAEGDTDPDFGGLDTPGDVGPTGSGAGHVDDNEPNWDFGEVVDVTPARGNKSDDGGFEPGTAAGNRVGDPEDADDFDLGPITAGGARAGRVDDLDDFDFDFDDDPTQPNARPKRAEPLKLLTVCTHNRTRSVMSMAMLQAGFDRAFGSGVVLVRSLGFGPEGVAAIGDAVEAMRRRALDVSDHRSRTVTADRLAQADLVLTAERDHVVNIAAISPDAFRKTFTLPEFCERALLDPADDHQTVEDWIESLSSPRVAVDYLSDDISEVDDPTGSPARQFEAATLGIERLCAVVVDTIGRGLDERNGPS